jgi:hypothetical protein
MTKAKSDRSTKTESEFSQLVEQLTHLAQEGLKQEIAVHKANGHPKRLSSSLLFDGSQQ